MELTSKEKILSEIYHDHTHPSGLGGVKLLLEAARGRDRTITRTDVKFFLRSSDVYTMHVTPRVNFQRLPILAPKPGTFLSLDIADLSSLSKHNRGYRYILVCVDIFSRVLQVRKMKRKTGEETRKALESILDDPLTGNVRRIHADRGSEFYNSKVLALLKQHKIKLYSTFSQEIKASHAERAIQTLKRLVYKFLTLKSTFSYVNALQPLVDKYNHTPHAGLKSGATPLQVHALTSLEDIRGQFNRMYRDGGYKRVNKKPRSHCYEVGQTVRVTLDSRGKAFYKAYKARFDEEYYTVHQVLELGCVPVYILKDLNGEILDGIFYSQELIAVEQPREYYPLRVLKSKGKGALKKYFVSWKGYPDSYNCWIDKSALETK